MPARFHANEIESPLYRPYRHHLAGDVVEREAEQGGIAPLQTEKATGGAGRVSHALLLHPNGFGFARRAAGVHQHAVGAVVPLV